MSSRSVLGLVLFGAGALALGFLAIRGFTPGADRAEAGSTPAAGTDPASQPAAARGPLPSDLLTPRMPRMPRVSAPVEPQPAPATAGLHVAILAALADPSVEIREDALRKVGQLRDPNHVESVAHMLYDPEPNVRKALLHALAKMRSPEAEVVVAQLLYDDDDEVVRDALLAASAGGYADALPQIRQIAGEDDLDLAVKAARALRRLGDDGAADAVIDRFVDALDEPGPMQRRHAVRQIGRIGGAAAIPYLSKIALRDPDLAVRREASWALENLRSSLELAE